MVVLIEDMLIVDRVSRNPREPLRTTKTPEEPMKTLHLKCVFDASSRSLLRTGRGRRKGRLGLPNIWATKERKNIKVNESAEPSDQSSFIPISHSASTLSSKTKETPRAEI